MAGIYLHIPFCRKACVYCDFHFSTLEKDRAAMPVALLKEAAFRKDYLPQQKLETIYFGGGTPSTLAPEILQGILDGLKEHFHWNSEVEITIEANPDDLTVHYLEALAKTEVNRLSIGLQSFKEEDLQLMNRAHNAKQSRHCLELAQKYGFHNLTVDLIYGLPQQTRADWLWQLEQLLHYKVPHFSAYALTVEPKTVLAKWVDKGKVELDEAMAAQHFEDLQSFAAEQAYEQYELSNFALAGHRARHNFAYWEGKPYLGLGPSAHSYNGSARHWNLANNALYLKGIEEGTHLPEEEDLSEMDRFNEMLMIRLRLVDGLKRVDLDAFSPSLKDHFDKELSRQKKLGRLIEEEGRIFIPKEQRFYSDGIASDLFYIEN